MHDKPGALIRGGLDGWILACWRLFRGLVALRRQAALSQAALVERRSQRGAGLPARQPGSGEVIE